MGDVSNQKFKHCSFQYWDSIGQYLSGTMPQLLEGVTSNRVVGIEAIDSLSEQDPSNLAGLLSICNEFAELNEDADMGVIKRHIPEMLERLYSKVQEYGVEHPKAYTENPLYSFNELIAEFENIGDSLGTEQYRKDKIAYLKERISYHIHQLFSLSEPER